jgi:hypothetical protein
MPVAVCPAAMPMENNSSKSETIKFFMVGNLRFFIKKNAHLRATVQAPK